MTPATSMSQEQVPVQSDNAYVRNHETKSIEQTSWKGYIVKKVLYGSSLINFGIAIYEGVNGSLTVSKVVSGLGDGAPSFSIFLAATSTGFLTLVLGCCSDRWIAEKKLEDNVTQLDDLNEKENEEIESELKTQLFTLKEELDKYKQLLNQSKLTNWELENKLDHAIKELADLKKKYEEAIPTPKELGSFIEKQKTQNTQLKTEIEKFHANIGKIKIETKRLDKNKDKESVVIQMEQWDSEIKALKKQNDILEQEKDDWVKITTDLKNQIELLEKDKAEEQQSRDQIIQKLNSLKDEEKLFIAISEKLEESEAREKEFLAVIDSLLSKLEGLTVLKEEFQPLIDAMKTLKS